MTLSGTIGKRRLGQLLSTLISDGYEVFGPTKKEMENVFSKIDSAEQLSMGYTSTILPPKKFLLPPSETILRQERSRQNAVGEEKTASKQVIFGIHSCDVNGLLFLDKVFLGDFPEPTYRARRENTLLIALSCTDVGDACFCNSLDTGPSPKGGFDLLLTDIGDRYLVETGSNAGERLMKKIPIDVAAPNDFKAKQATLENARAKFKKSVETNRLPEIVEKSLQHPVWAKLGDICLACGSCAIVCPTCYCFDVRDTVDLRLENSERLREWDECLLLEFSEVAMGGNFRRDRSARIRQFMCHNLSYGIAQYGDRKCVGCGRCIRACPVRIDITEAAKELRGG